MITNIRCILLLTAISSSMFASAQTLSESLKLSAADGAIDDEYGHAVAIVDTRAIIGSPYDDDLGADSGSVYVRSGQQAFKLNASDGASGDRFGSSVAVSGTFAIVGAPHDSEDGFGTGAAYVFDLTTGEEIYKLLADVPDGADYFGSSVAIDGTTAVVGAIGVNDIGTLSGAAYVFDLTTGELLFKLKPELASIFQYFGQSVSVAGNKALIGAPGLNGNGLAYIFDTTTGQELHVLAASDGASQDQFGYAVSMAGSKAVIGAWKDDDAGDQSGSAYIFDISSGQQLHKLTASNASGSDNFGYSVTASESFALIGAPIAGDTGGAYAYDMNTGDEVYKLFPSDVTTGARTAHSLSISGTFVLAGARFDNDHLGNNNTGSAFIFNMTPFCPADLNGDNTLDFFDISAFLTAFSNQDSIADFSGDGLIDFFDISAFLTAYSQGCP